MWKLFSFIISLFTGVRVLNIYDCKKIIVISEYGKEMEQIVDFSAYRNGNGIICYTMKTPSQPPGTMSYFIQTDGYMSKVRLRNGAKMWILGDERNESGKHHQKNR